MPSHLSAVEDLETRDQWLLGLMTLHDSHDHSFGLRVKNVDNGWQSIS